MISMTVEQAKQLLAKEYKDMSPEERKLVPIAIKLLASKWAQQ